MSSADATGGPEAEASESEPASPPRHQALLEALTSELGDAVVGSELRRDDLWVRVRADSWRQTAEVCRDKLAMDYFCFLSGIDWMPHTWPNPKVESGGTVEVGDAEEDDAETERDPDEAPPEAEAGFTSDEPASGPGQWKTGYAGGDSRFQVLARVYSTSRHMGFTLKADLDDERPQVETWTAVYAGADWHERETWEMYGFDFIGHPNLIHLYLPSEFEGFPLRKDFPLLSREVKPWPGLVDVEPMPEEPEESGNGAATSESAEAATSGGEEA